MNNKPCFRQKQILSWLFGFALIFFALLFAEVSLAGSPGAHYGNPLNVGSFSDLIGNFLANLQGIVGWLAVIMIMIGGVLYITSGGRSSQVTLAKTMIVFALIGFAIAVAAPSLLREVRDIAVGFSGIPSAISSATPLAEIIANVLDFMLTMVGVLAIIGFTISGIMYVTSAGDSSKADTAKKMMLYSIIAVAVTGAGMIILKQVLELLDK